MKRIDIFISSPEDVQAERSLVERSIRSIAAEFCVPITVTYSNWLRRLNAEDKLVAQTANVREEGRSWLCPCFWEYQDDELDPDYREQMPNTGSYDLVISILWSRLGTRISPTLVKPDGSRPRTANDYEIAWVLDQLTRTPGFPELRVYRNRSAPLAPSLPNEDWETVFRQWDAVREFYGAWEKQQAFTDACSDYSDLEVFENLFREHFRGFLARQLEKEVVPRKRLSKAPYWKPNPYRGLRYFDFEHATAFHGRTKAVGEVLDALRKQASAQKPFVLVLGASGSGKTSLVRAGVLPLLTEVGIGDGIWRRAVTRPGPGGNSGDPFDALAVALLAKDALPELQKAPSHDEWRKVAAELREHPDSVALRVRELLDRISLKEFDRLLDEQDDLALLPGRIESLELARHRRLRRVKPKARLALVVDQFEDLFVSGFSPELQQRYIALLAALVRCQRVYVVAALRSDFYTSYQQFPELVGLVGRSGRVDLLPPTRSELRSIILLPAQAAGLSFERDSKANRSLDEVLTDAAVACSDPLPLLEDLLSELHRKQLDREDGLLRWCDYRELGEFSGALASHAEAVFAALDSDAQQTFEVLMRRLAALGPDGEPLCRPVPYQDLVSSPELDSRLKAGAKSLIDCLVQGALFSTETDARQEVFVSVAHSALLKGWPRVQRWLAEDQEFLRIRDRVDGCLKLWLNRGRHSRHLLRPGSGLADGETLINHFHFSLSEAQVDYIKRSVTAQRRGRRIRRAVAVLVLVGLASLGAVAGVNWFIWDSQRKSLDEYRKLEGRIAELTQGESDAIQNATKNAEDSAQRAEQRADQAAAQLGLAQTAFKAAEEKARQNADFATTRRREMEVRLKKTEERAEQAQQSADLAAAQRNAMEAQLKEAQQSADLAKTQRTAMEAQLKEAEEKAQLAERSADLAATQRTATETQLKEAVEQVQLAQRSANLGATQRGAMETQLKQAEEKTQLAQQTADRAWTERNEMEVQLKKAEEKAELAQKVVESVSARSDTIESESSKGEPVKKSADLPPSQIGSGRALPLDTGQNAEPVFPAQPLLAPVQSANH